MQRSFSKNIKRLEDAIGIKFKNETLVKQAFIHSSYGNEHKLTDYQNNERLEFLGDAVLELLVSEYLFNKYSQLPEGELTKRRAQIVCEPSLVRFAEQLNLGMYVMLGKGEEQTGGRTRPALLADLFEALVGALYLDQGQDAVKRFLERHMFPFLESDERSVTIDHKSKLQEYTQQRSLGQIEYRIEDESGPAHERHFVCAAYLNDQCIGQGAGRSKKEAEQQAAARSLDLLKMSPKR